MLVNIRNNFGLVRVPIFQEGAYKFLYVKNLQNPMYHITPPLGQNECQNSYFSYSMVQQVLLHSLAI